MRRPTGKGVPITQPFKGWRHNGVDFSGRLDTYVYAPEAGRLYYQRQIVGGNVARVLGVMGEHRLAHLSKYLVPNGSLVREGQKIAVMGDTGWSTARHLHWGLIRNGKYVDPLLYVSKPTKKKSDLVIAKEVIAGKWGNGPARALKLKKAGYNPVTIQRIVNRLIK